MSKHVEGKWELEEQDKRFLIYCEPYEQDIAYLPKTDKTSEYNHDIDNDVVEANAHFIVKACNSHHELLEALEAVENAMMAEQGFIPNFMASALKNARGEN